MTKIANNTFLSLLQTITFITAVAVIYAYSQDDSPRSRGYGFLMLEEPINPKNTAMGSVGTAMGGQGFRYYNPVAPFFSASSYASSEFGRMPGDVNKGGFESALILPNWFAAVTVYYNAVDYETRDERGFGTAATSSTTVGAISAGYIRDNASLGISVNMAEDRIWIESSYTAVAMSVGLGYKLLNDRLNLGAAWFHCAARSSGFGDNPYAWGSGRVPQFARAGAAWNDTVKSLPYTIAVDAVYRDENGTFTVPIGVDVQILPYVNLRIGKRIGWETEALSFGIGLNIDRIAFDAAFAPVVFVDDYDMKWSMGFTYNLGVRRKAKTSAQSKEQKITEPSNPQDTAKREEPLPQTDDSATTAESQNIAEPANTEEETPTVPTETPDEAEADEFDNSSDANDDLPTKIHEPSD